MTRSPWTRRLSAGIAGATALVLTSAMAHAVWSAAGAGATSAKAGTAAALTATADVPGALYPGSSATLTLKVNNPNGFGATVTAVSFGTITAANGCSTAGITVTPPASLPRAVVAGGSVTLTATVSMSTSTSNACQGTTFSVPVTATGRVS
jgi:hypothetical protein